MSRLIDADDLIIEILTHDLIGDDKRIDKIILDAPTVKAIPIEWIKKWCNEHNRKSLEERLLKRYGVITMLDDWEKENEQTN